MAEEAKPPSVIEFMLSWMERPENKSRIDADDPMIAREYDLAMHRFMRDHPQPASPEKPAQPKAQEDKPAPRLPFDDFREAERCMGWLSYPEWKEKGEGRMERLHPIARDAFIQQYEFWIADIVDGAVDPVERWGMDRAAAIANLKSEAAPFLRAQEEFRRNPPKMPPAVEAHYRKQWPWFFATKAERG